MSRRSEKHAAFRPAPRLPKAKRRKIVSMIVNRRAAEYRASLERQISEGGTITIPIELHAALMAINAPYLTVKRATPQA